MRPPDRRLPAGPLLELVRLDTDRPHDVPAGEPGSWSLPQAAARCATTVRTLHRWTPDGIPLRSADQAAIRAGLQPELVWPDLLDPPDVALPPVDRLVVPLTCPRCGMRLHLDEPDHGGPTERRLGVWCPEHGAMTVTVTITPQESR